MPFDPRLAEIRFGCGLARLTGADGAGTTWPIARFGVVLPQLHALEANIFPGLDMGTDPHLIL